MNPIAAFHTNRRPTPVSRARSNTPAQSIWQECAPRRPSRQQRGVPRRVLSVQHVLSNPVKYKDPTGHADECSTAIGACGGEPPDPRDLLFWILKELNYLPTMPDGVEIKELLSPELIPFSSYYGRLFLAGSEFHDLVKDGALLDVKDKIEDLLGDKIRLGDFWFEYSTPGNILFGFYGTAWGWDSTSLHIGAGFAQIMDGVRGKGIGPLGLGFDTADDFSAIDLGIQLYNEAYAPDGRVTATEFLEMLSNFESLSTMNPATSTSNPVPLDPGWPYFQGFFYNDG
jgi:hypothetical protein